MYKVSYIVGKINKGMKLKFNITVRGEKKFVSYKPNASITDMNMEVSYLREMIFGNMKLLQMNTFPTLTVDISGDSYDRRDPNNAVALNQQNVFNFYSLLRRMISKFKVSDLFAYSAGALVVNPELSKEFHETMTTNSLRYITMYHAVVPDYEEIPQMHEGVKFYIGNSTFVNLTYVDLCFLYKKVDSILMQWESLSAQLFNTYVLSQVMNNRDRVIDSAPVVIEEEKIVENTEVRIPPKVINEELPDI